MKKRIDKSILNRIEQLEIKYPYVDIDATKTQIDLLIEFLENYFGYNIRSRIDFSKLEYKNTDDPEKELFNQLTEEELKELADDIMKNKKSYYFD